MICCGWHGGPSRWIQRMPSTSSSMLVKPGGHTSQIRPGTVRRHSSAGRRLHQNGAIMIVKVLLGILTGGAMFVLASNSFGANAAGVLWPGFTSGMLISLGLSLAGLGMWGRKKIRKGTMIDGRYLALGMREVNLRGASLFQRTNQRKGGRTWMKMFLREMEGNQRGSQGEVGQTHR